MIKDETHCVPMNDLREHLCSPHCWCEPTQDADEPSLWVHNSLDGREHLVSMDLFYTTALIDDRMPRSQTVLYDADTRGRVWLY